MSRLTVYTLTVAIPEDPTADDGLEERELTGQLRLAAQAVASGSAPLPGEPPRALVTPTGVGIDCTVYLSAVIL